MECRPALPSDLSSLARLMEQLGYPDCDLKNLFDLYSSDPSMGIWVAADGKVMGCLAFHVLRQFHGPSLFRIVSLAVEASFRRRGVGRFLLERAEREAKERGCEAVELTSALRRSQDGSHEFYRKLGYLDSGECGKCYFRKALCSKNCG